MYLAYKKLIRIENIYNIRWQTVFYGWNKEDLPQVEDLPTSIPSEGPELWRFQHKYFHRL
jgi:hypothetical protein